LEKKSRNPNTKDTIDKMTPASESDSSFGSTEQQRIYVSHQTETSHIKIINKEEPSIKVPEIESSLKFTPQIIPTSINEGE
jgi:hypothetical protein